MICEIVNGSIKMGFKKQDQENERTFSKKQIKYPYCDENQKYLKQCQFIDDYIDLRKLKTVELSGCSLSTIPHSFRLLCLVNLNLSNNMFSEIPSCLFNGLRTLEEFDISYNKIRYFPITKCISNLKKLKLNDNNFESIPHWFLTFACVSLEEFDYSHNRASHYKFWKYSYLDKVNIKKLNLKNACLIDKDLSMLKKFKNLEYLDIGNEATYEPKVLKYVNKFKDLDMLFIRPSWWRKLTVLKVKNLNLVMFPPGILWLESLQELDISNNYISWIGEDIKYLVNLEMLDISNNQFFGLPRNIEYLKYLKTIRAQHNSIEDISALPESLLFLDLYDNLIDNVFCDISDIYCDLECNFIKMNDVQYARQRDILRLNFGEWDRVNKCVPKEEHCDSESSKSSDISEVDDNFITNISVSSTEKCTWETSSMPNIMEPTFYRVYVHDEDWMFEDID